MTHNAGPTCPTSTNCCRWSSDILAGAPQGGPPRSPGQPVRRPGLRLTAASPGVGSSDRPPPGTASDQHGSGLGVYRWVAERTLSWLHSFRRLQFRTDREGPVHEPLSSHRLQLSYVCGSYDKVFLSGAWRMLSGLNQKVSGQVRGLRIPPSRMVHHWPRGTTLPRVDREGERRNPVVSPQG